MTWVRLPSSASSSLKRELFLSQINQSGNILRAPAFCSGSCVVPETVWCSALSGVHKLSVLQFTRNKNYSSIWCAADNSAFGMFCFFFRCYVLINKLPGSGIKRSTVVPELFNRNLSDIKKTFQSIPESFLSYTGFEPVTHALKGRCSTYWASSPSFIAECSITISKL